MRSLPARRKLLVMRIIDQGAALRDHGLQTYPLESAMSPRHPDPCVLCGATQQERPLVQTAFHGEAVSICIVCMPTACRGLDCSELAEKVREKRSRELNERPLARPGLRY